MPIIKINENHRRALASSLEIVEATLNDFVWMIRQLQSSESGSLPQQKQQKILQKIESARQQISQIRTLFKIPTKARTDPVWAIQVGVGRIWEILEDCKAGRLRGYGEVPNVTRPVLDEQIQKLIEMTQQIATVASENSG